MIRVTCPSSGKTLGVKDSLAGTMIRCPVCGQEHAVPAAAPAPPPLPPGPAGPPAGETRARAVCVFHPQVPGVGRCGSCRKSLCETCAFRSGPRIFCADCASKPNPERAGLANRRGILSLVLGIGSVVGMVVFMVLSVVMVDSPDQGTEAIVGCVFLVPLALAVAGLALGFMSRDPATGRSTVGLIGLVLNLILLIFFLLLVVVGLMMPA